MLGFSNIKMENWNFEFGYNGLIQDNFSTPDTGKRLIPDYIKFENGIYILGSYQESNLFVGVGIKTRSCVL